MNTVDYDNLGALPNAAVIKTDHGIYIRNKPRLFPDEWCWVKQGNVGTYPRIYLRRPAEVLYNPDAPAPESDEQGTVEAARLATERVAKVILEEVEPGFDWETANRDHRELYREVARAAIQAMVSE